MINLSTATQELLLNKELQAQTLIKDMVMQIDDKIILAIMLIFIGYFMAQIILPRAVIGLRELNNIIKIKKFDVVNNFFIEIIEKGISLFETLSLGSACFILYIAYFQGLIPSYLKTTLICLFSILILIFIMEIVSYIKNKKYKATLLKWSKN